MESPPIGARLFLIGSDASHAMSASLWNPVLQELGSTWRYEAWDVPAGASMSGVRARLLEGDVVAANITMPHKQWAARAADTVSEPVRLSGAANLLINRGSELAGFNTDVAAVAALLGDRPQRHAVMLGAGGAARAALAALRGSVMRVTVADRDTRAATELAACAVGLGMAAEALPWAEAQSQARNASLIVNATPVGKGPDDGPVWGDGALAEDAAVYDFVYAGHVTASIAAAREQGLTCVDGWDHLQAQAAAMVPLLGLASEACLLLTQTLAQIRARH
ncbi:shikimate dehydrogenase family protein [Arthrobacter sp. MMS18-M83]|uniref:shikimate dehydrogenase family protein n=1 Tax=Arthrobacter sp. MMS18-M83 TaxID=2996261 RepID=UPI00227C36A1|nr:shikimate dehydrogenase [Arthrobacter sp. MMS18-M83]WAH96257.1 shikimate dehydrogenase [Arthrobacter sp. MMS18-M83]